MNSIARPCAPDQAQQQAKDDALIGQIERRGRFVQHQDAAIGGQRARQKNELPLAATE